MILKKVHGLFFFLLLVPIFGFAGNVDSLQRAINKMPNDTNKIKEMLELSKAFKLIDNHKAKELADKCLFESQRLSYKKGMIYAYTIIGSIYFYQRHFDSALYFHQKVEELSKIYKPDYLSSVYINIANVYALLAIQEPLINYKRFFCY